MTSTPLLYHQANDMPNGTASDGHPDPASRIVPTVHTDVLVVGTGPAGGSLASFLASQGVKGLMIGMHSSTARTPRAHYTNMAAFECLRDIDVEDDARKAGHSRDYYTYYRFCESMAGEEYLRSHGLTWNPQRQGDYTEASPCEHADLPQNYLEPILLKYATQHGFHARFDCKLLSFTEDSATGLVHSTVMDLLTSSTFHVVSNYLCGADGANSLVASELDLPFQHYPMAGIGINVWYKADLSHICKDSAGLLHSCLAAKSTPPPWGVAGINRFIRPWDEWLMVILGVPGLATVTATEEEILARTRELIGDDTVPITLKGISTWAVNEAYALRYTSPSPTHHPRVFCLGDAVHRHPPGNGLGSNTCIQDAYNLAWKLAHVLRGVASPALLESYNAERQPVGQRVVKIANDAFRKHFALYTALGTMDPELAARTAALAELSADTPAAAKRRVEVQEALEALDDERQGLGAELNQTYVSSAVRVADEAGPAPDWMAQGESHSIRHHDPGTYPGSRLPHAWVTPKGLVGKKVSTHDLAGRGRWTLFTGIGGGSWTAAVKTLAAGGGDGSDPLGALGIDARAIGWGQEFDDTFFMWTRRRGVRESGCVLVRPDRTVAWRCEVLAPGVDVEGCVRVLRGVLRGCLGWE